MKSAKLPTSGSEPLFSDLVYGTPRGRVNNNCYAWAIDAYRGSGGIKLQPGNISRQTTNKNASSCPFIRDRTMDDNRQRGIYAVDPKAMCRKGFYKIMSFIDPGNDYHWYKQNGSLLYRVSENETPASIARDLGVRPSAVVTATRSLDAGDLVFVRNAGVFSHKQGFATGPLLRDASHQIIPDPRYANRDYGDYNYKKFCGAMCIRNVRTRDMSKTLTKAESAKLHSLLDKRVSLLHARGKKRGNDRRVRAKV